MPTGRIFLLEGSPGTGKTTMALRFLLEGAAAGERGLYITLSETAPGAARHRGVARLELDGIDDLEVVPPESLLDGDQQQSLLYSSDLELGETTRLIFEAVERVKAARGSSSIPCRRSACLPRVRCAIDGRSWP